MSKKVETPTPSIASGMLAARAAALRDFDAMPDDAHVGFAEIALLDGRAETAVRQAYSVGRLRIPRVPGCGRRARFTVAAVRRYLRGELESEAA